MAEFENTDFHFTLPATINGVAITADWAHATFDVLTGPAAASNNETEETVKIGAGQFAHGAREVYAALPSHSMGSLVIPVMGV
jgi:hypothetical protein